MSTSAICDLASEAIASTRSQEQISPRSWSRPFNRQEVTNLGVSSGIIPSPKQCPAERSCLQQSSYLVFAWHNSPHYILNLHSSFRNYSRRGCNREITLAPSKFCHAAIVNASEVKAERSPCPHRVPKLIFLVYLFKKRVNTVNVQYYTMLHSYLNATLSVEVLALALLLPSVGLNSCLLDLVLRARSELSS
jgi:hypothetical protein